MSNVKFWVALKNEAQLDFEGRSHIITRTVGEVHIVKNEVLMCRQSREVLKKDLQADGGKVVATRPQNISVCHDCQERYKNDSDLPYVKWVNAVAIQGGITPKMMGEK